jgi:hypothetical protein
MAPTLTRVSVSVWLPAAAHARLAAAAAAEGVSLPVLSRRAASAAVSSPGGRVSLPAAPAEVVEELRTAGYALNRLVPAAEAAASVAQRAAIGARIATALDRISVAAAGLRLNPCAGNGPTDRDGWRLVRVTTEPGTAARWWQAARAAGFRSVGNWVRDGLAGMHGLDIARPPAPSTIDARAVAGRVAGLVARVEAVVVGWPVNVAGLEDRIEAAGAAVWEALESLIAYGGDPKARR